MAEAPAKLRIRPVERRRSNRPDVAATRMRILRTAERLFAERGLFDVSLREIAVAAAQGNNNAVQYHFETRERLINAIFKQRVMEMEPQRRMMLDRAAAAGKLGDPRVLLEIISRPHLALGDADGRHPHAGFLLQYLTHRLSEDQLPRLLDDLDAPALTRLIGLLSDRCTHLPTSIAWSRVGLCCLMFLNLLVHRDSLAARVPGDDAFDRLVDDTLAAMTAAMMEPCEYGRESLPASAAA